MKRIIFTLICALSLANVSAQTAKEILDKAASVVNAKKGATMAEVMKDIRQKYTFSKDKWNAARKLVAHRGPAADDESLPLHQPL